MLTAGFSHRSTSSQLSTWVVCEQRDTLLHCWRECNCSPSLWKDLMLVKHKRAFWGPGICLLRIHPKEHRRGHKECQSNNVELQDQNYENRLWEGESDGTISAVSTTAFLCLLTVYPSNMILQDPWLSSQYRNLVPTKEASM